MNRRPPKPCPEELLYTGFHWETLRELYFVKLQNWSKASEVRSIRRKYHERLWDKGITVDLEKGFTH